MDAILHDARRNAASAYQKVPVQGGPQLPARVGSVLRAVSSEQ
jgi:hypothetical protein